MQRSTISILLGISLLILGLGASFQTQWVTSNSQGPITYTVREAGLPLQWILFEVSSPVGPSSYFKLDPLLMAVDLVIWACVAYGALYLLKLPRSAAKAPTESTTPT